MNQGEVEPIARYYESIERWDTKFGKVYIHGRELAMIGNESFLWSGLLAKSELRQLLNELFEHASRESPALGDSRGSSRGRPLTSKHGPSIYLVRRHANGVDSLPFVGLS